MGAPPWALSMIANFRTVYKARYNRDSDALTDEEVFDIIEGATPLETGEQEEIAVTEDMYAAIKKKG